MTVLIQLPGEIKQILETELGIPVSKMLLKGWKSGDVSDSVSTLHVQHKRFLGMEVGINILCMVREKKKYRP